MADVFSILTLPRCRSAWLANFLDYPPATVVHEPSRLRPNWRELRTKMEAGPYRYAGLVDPSVVSINPMGWLDAFGDRPVGIIIRPASQVVASIVQAFPQSEEAAAGLVDHAYRNLAQINETLGGCPTIHAEYLSDPAICAGWLAKLVPGLPFWEGRFIQLSRLRITALYHEGTN